MNREDRNSLQQAPQVPGAAGGEEEVPRAERHAPPNFIHKPLEMLTEEEWEALCDGCGRCCLVKLEDEDTGRIHTTAVVCALWDTEKGGCRDYAHRFDRMPDCLRVTVEKARTLSWLPDTCAYRRRAEGRPLPGWHPLLTGDPASVHAAGASILGRVVSEAAVALEDLPRFITDWLSPPDDWPVPDAPAEGDSGQAKDKR